MSSHQRLTLGFDPMIVGSIWFTMDPVGKWNRSASVICFNNGSVPIVCTGQSTRNTNLPSKILPLGQDTLIPIQFGDQSILIFLIQLLIWLLPHHSTTFVNNVAISSTELDLLDKNTFLD